MGGPLGVSIKDRLVDYAPRSGNWRSWARNHLVKSLRLADPNVTCETHLPAISPNRASETHPKVRCQTRTILKLVRLVRFRFPAELDLREPNGERGLDSHSAERDEVPLYAAVPRRLIV